MGIMATEKTVSAKQEDAVSGNWIGMLRGSFLSFYQGPQYSTFCQGLGDLT